MAKSTVVVIPFLALLLCSCESDPKPYVSGFWVPTMTISADEDEAEPGGDIRFDADLGSGSGWAVRTGFHEDGEGLGVLYMTTRHSERSAGTHARTHSAYLEYYHPLVREEEMPLFVGLAGGVGGAAFDFDSTFDDTGAAAGMARFEVGFAPTENLSIRVGGGGFLWGYPGETIGTGGFVLLGLGLDF
jgi:hypothetical protein